MYAVVRTGGKQYTVAINDLLRVERLPGGKGDAVTLEDVILIGTGDGIQTGAEASGHRVTGTIVHQGRAKKVLIFKKRKRSTYRRTQGHRQDYTELRITSID